MIEEFRWAFLRLQGESENEKHEREKEALLAKMAAANEESKKAVKMERDSHEEDVERLTREKVELRQDGRTGIGAIRRINASAIFAALMHFTFLLLTQVTQKPNGELKSRRQTNVVGRKGGI